MMDGSGIHGHGSRQPSIVENDSPSYWVEHLATFAVGRQFGLQYPEDGVRKLKQLENNSAIWAQPMVLRLQPKIVSVEDENGDIVEQFPMDLVTTPTAYLSTNTRDLYNNILLFVVKEDKKRGRSSNPTEMHIFQCNRVSANDVVEDIKSFLTGHYQRVRAGRRDTGFVIGYQPPIMMGPPQRAYRDDASASSDNSESFDRDVNTLNRCFDDIERFVARIQSAAIAQRELEAQANRQRTKHSKRGSHTPMDQQSGILQMRSQVPAEFEFVDTLQKFKLSFNLLAKLKNHIHEPNAPELLHFLFTPLTIILDACHWGLGRNIAPQVVSPLLSRDTRDLMQNCLTSKEADVWMALGEAWRITPENWNGPLPKPYRPVFLDGFAPYGPPDMPDGLQNSMRSQPVPLPMHRGVSAPPPPTQTDAFSQRPPIRDHSVDNLNINLDRMSLEKERLNFEREKIAERERRLVEDERMIMLEKQRLAAEKELMAQEAEQRSMGSSYIGRQNETSRQPSPAISRPAPQYSSQMNGDSQITSQVGLLSLASQSPRQKAFIDDIINRRAKLAQVTYDRISQNPKELTVNKGEFLEVLNDSKNWWECTNVHHRVGYVPHTILSAVNIDNSISPHSLTPQDTSSRSSDRMGMNQQYSSNRVASSSLSPRPGMMSDDTPDYIKQRQDSFENVGTNFSNTNGSTELPVNKPLLSPSQAAIPPPAPPIITPDFNSIKLRSKPSTNELVLPKQQPEKSKSANEKETKMITAIQKGGDHIPPDEHIAEIRSTIGTEKGRQILKKRTDQKNEILITDQSTAQEVQNWLTEKGFSKRVHELLINFDGAHLFSLGRPKLIETCSRDEGSRLYSQILLQKSIIEDQLQAKTELSIILDHRKGLVDSTGGIFERKKSVAFSGDEDAL